MHSPLLQKRERKLSERLGVVVPIILFGAACILLTTILHPGSPVTDNVEKEVALWNNIGIKTCVDISYTCMGDWLLSEGDWSRSLNNGGEGATGYQPAQGPLGNAVVQNVPNVANNQAHQPNVPNANAANGANGGGSSPRSEDAVGTMRKLLTASQLSIVVPDVEVMNDPLHDPISPLQSPSESRNDVAEDEEFSQTPSSSRLSESWDLMALVAATNEIQNQIDIENGVDPAAQGPPPPQPPLDEEAIPYVGDQKMPYICTIRRSRQPPLTCTRESKFDNIGPNIGSGGFGTVTVTGFKNQPGLVSPFADLRAPVVVKKLIKKADWTEVNYQTQIGVLYREAIVGVAIDQRAPGLAVKTIDVYKDQDPVENYFAYANAEHNRAAREFYLVQQPRAHGHIKTAHFQAFLMETEVYYIATVMDTLLHMVNLLHNTAGFTHLDLKGENIYFLHKGQELALIFGDLGSALPIPEYEHANDHQMSRQEMPGVEGTPETLLAPDYLNIEAHDVWCVVVAVFKIYFGLDKFEPEGGWEANFNKKYKGNELALLQKRVGKHKENRMIPFFANALKWENANRHDVGPLRDMLVDIIGTRNADAVKKVQARYKKEFATEIQAHPETWSESIAGQAMIPNCQL